MNLPLNTFIRTALGREPKGLLTPPLLPGVTRRRRWNSFATRPTELGLPSSQRLSGRPRWVYWLGCPAGRVLFRLWWCGRKALAGGSIFFVIFLTWECHFLSQVLYWLVVFSGFTPEWYPMSTQGLLVCMYTILGSSGGTTWCERGYMYKVGNKQLGALTINTNSNSK